jgi:hypothetical protein
MADEEPDRRKAGLGSSAGWITCLERQHALYSLFRLGARKCTALLECGCATLKGWSCRFRTSRGARRATGWRKFTGSRLRITHGIREPISTAKAVAAFVPHCATAVHMGGARSALGMRLSSLERENRWEKGTFPAANCRVPMHRGSYSGGQAEFEQEDEDDSAIAACLVVLTRLSPALPTRRAACSRHRARAWRRGLRPSCPA